MTNIRSSSVYILVMLALLVVVVGFSQATPTNFIVQGGAEVTHSIDLIAEDRVLIQIKYVGGNVGTMHFFISFPNATERDFGATGDFSYSFICDVEGEHVLHFVNTDKTENQVFLDYEVQHYIFGIPQMLAMALIVVLACIGGVVVYVLLGRSY